MCLEWGRTGGQHHGTGNPRIQLHRDMHFGPMGPWACGNGPIIQYRKLNTSSIWKMHHPIKLHEFALIIKSASDKRVDLPAKNRIESVT